jgi:hypothetical protein
MLKENAKVTEALIQLINAMPEAEKERIARSITKRKRRTSRKEKTPRQKIEALITGSAPPKIVPVGS